MTTKNVLPRFYQVKQSLIRDIVSSGMAIGGVLSSAHQIAKQYGVSYMTARRALDELIEDGVLKRNPGCMAELVQLPEIVEEEKSIGNRRTGNVFIFTHSDVIKNPSGYVAGVFHSIEKHLFENGFTPMHRLIRRETNIPEMVKTEARSTNVDALISCSIHRESELKIFADTGLPVVSVDFTPKQCIVDSVTTNNYAIVQRAILHLLSLGHRRIDFIGHFHNAPVIDFDAKEMEFYWRECIADAGATGQSHYLADDDLRAALSTMASRTDAPTAVFISNPWLAQRAFDVIKEIGYSVPADISIITQGGSFAKDFKLTSIDIDWYEIARLAVQRVLDLVRNRSTMGARLMHAGRFIDRGTTGANLKSTDVTTS
mgnify:CR=1 FL=1